MTTRGETQRFPASKTNISSKCSYVKSESLRAVETLEFEPDPARGGAKRVRILPHYF